MLFDQRDAFEFQVLLTVQIFFYSYWNCKINKAGKY